MKKSDVHNAVHAVNADYVPPINAIVSAVTMRAHGRRNRLRERMNATRLLNPSRASELLALHDHNPTKKGN